MRNADETISESTEKKVTTVRRTARESKPSSRLQAAYEGASLTSAKQSSALGTKKEASSASLK